MKKGLLIVASMVCFYRVSSAQEISHMPSNGFFASGRIEKIHQNGQNNWGIGIADIKVLAQAPDLLWGKDASVTNNAPNKIDLNLLTGLGGILISPDDKWIGLPVVFVAIESQGGFTVSNTRFPLAPNGRGFYVFHPSERSAFQMIEQTIQTLTVTNTTARLKKMIDMVESSTEPRFIRRFCIEHIAETVFMHSADGLNLDACLHKWRDDSAFDPELRIRADEMLITFSPRAYQWSEARFSFLRDLCNRYPDNKIYDKSFSEATQLLFENTEKDE